LAKQAPEIFYVHIFDLLHLGFSKGYKSDTWPSLKKQVLWQK